MTRKLNLDKLKNSTMEEKMPLIALAVFLVIALVMILVSFFALSIPIVAVCTFVVLEALLCALLNNIPIWVHGIIVIAEVVAGVLFSKVVFMILMAVVYVAAVALLYVWTNKKVTA